MREGTAEARSGEWRWFETTLHSLPDQTVEYRSITLWRQDAPHDGSMVLRLPPDLEELPDVSELIPWIQEREIVVGEDLWHLAVFFRPRLDTTSLSEWNELEFPSKVRVWTKGRRGSYVEWPFPHRLGELTDEEARELIDVG